MVPAWWEAWSNIGVFINKILNLLGLKRVSCLKISQFLYPSWPYYHVTLIKIEEKRISDVLNVFVVPKNPYFDNYYAYGDSR